MVTRAYLVDKCPHCGGRLVVRNLEQNAKLHALLQDIATQKQWAEQWLDVETWKRLLTAAWTRTSGGRALVYPAIDGHGVDVLYRRTSRLTKQEMTELIEYVQAWAVDSGIVLHDPEPLETR